MKTRLRDVFLILLGFVSGFAIQEYAIVRHKSINKAEKEALKQKIERENRILIGRLEEDYEAFKDSITQVFIKEKKEFYRKRGGEPPSGAKHAIEMRFNAQKDRILAKKRKQIDREIEDLEMRLDF